MRNPYFIISFDYFCCLCVALGWLVWTSVPSQPFFDGFLIGGLGTGLVWRSWMLYLNLEMVAHHTFYEIGENFESNIDGEKLYKIMAQPFLGYMCMFIFATALLHWGWIVGVFVAFIPVAISLASLSWYRLNTPSG